MGAPVTITVQALTAEAAANLNAFVNNAEGGFRRVEQRAGSTGVHTESLGKKFGALRHVVALLGFETFPQLTSAMMLTSDALKTVQNESGASAVSLGKMGAIAALLAGAVWATQESFNALWDAEAKQVEQGDAITQSGHLLNYIKQLGESGKLSAKQVGELTKELGATPDLKQVGAMQKKLKELMGDRATDLEMLKARAEIISQQIQQSSTRIASPGETISTAPLIVADQRLLATVYADTAREIKKQQEILREKLGFDKPGIKTNKEWIELEKQREDAMTRAADVQSQAYVLEGQVLDLKRQQIQDDWRLTNAEKYAQLKGLGETNLGPDPNSFGQQLGANATGMLNQIGTVAQNAAGIVTNTLGAAFDGISQSISGLILGTVTWGQALLNIGRTIVTTLINSFVQFFVNILARAVLNALVGTAIQSAAAASAAAIWAGPAILASIATSGAAAAQAPISVAAALATAPSLGALGAVAGFAEGGFTGPGGRYEPAGIVHRGEFVMNASTVSRYGVPALESLQRGNGSATGNPGAGAANVKVIMVADLRQAALEAMKSDKGQEIVVQHVNGRRIDIGMIT